MSVGNSCRDGVLFFLSCLGDVKIPRGFDFVPVGGWLFGMPVLCVVCPLIIAVYPSVRAFGMCFVLVGGCIG